MGAFFVFMVFLVLGGVCDVVEELGGILWWRFCVGFVWGCVEWEGV